MDEIIGVGDMVKIHQERPLELEVVSEKDELGFYDARIPRTGSIVKIHERVIVSCQKNP
jgi:hypothetical protein